MTVQGPVKEQQPDGMSHRGLDPPPPRSSKSLGGGGSFFVTGPKKNKGP